MTHCNHCIQNDQPLKYMVESMTKDRKLNSAHLESIDTSTELRSKPTNLNYYNSLMPCLMLKLYYLTKKD